MNSAEFVETEDDAVAAMQDWFLDYRSRPQALARTAALVLFLAVTAAAYLYWGGLSIEYGSLGGVIILGYAVGAVALAYLISYLRLPSLARRYRRQEKTLDHRCRFTWSEQDIEVQTSKGSVRYNWRDFHRVKFARSGMLLFVNDRTYMYLPRRVVSAEGWESLRRSASAGGAPIA